MSPDLPSSDSSSSSSAEIQAQAHRWASQLGSGDATVDDVAAFRRWRAQSPAHAQAWTAASQGWRQMGAVAQAFKDEHPLSIPTPRDRRVNRRLFFGAAVSAFGTLAVAGVLRPPLGLWPSWSELNSDYRTATGEQRGIALAAGRIQVAMNTQTSVSVRQGGEATRIELVAGEAAVSARQTSCDVLAGAGVVHVAGGDVEVRWLDARRVRLRCNEGSVELRHPLRSLTLPAHNEVVYERDALGDPRNIASSTAAWREGMVVFQDLPLSKVVDEINRYRPGRVILVNEKLANLTFNASVQISALDNMIERLGTQQHIEVRHVGALVFLG